MGLTHSHSVEMENTTVDVIGRLSPLENRRRRERVQKIRAF
ncbi:hypothetical protein CASFOL_012605 [Castilleja foliolosa]|uniref:Uncharacterized protein n=1 Tax=Castilleja foliolosa TaxID=1961234 RepID=A0ABD3DHI4_9LAMI